MWTIVLVVCLVLIGLFLLSGGAWPWIVSNGIALINGVLAGNMVSILILVILLLLLGIALHRMFGR